MKEEKSTRIGRRSLMSNLGAAALAGAAVGATPALAQKSSDKFEPRRHALDAWMNELPGDHRVFIDTSDATGGSNALQYGSNILNAHVNAYEGSDADMAMIICFRHISTPFGYNNAMWEKYGEQLGKMTQQTNAEGGSPTINPVLARVEGMAQRGVQFAICNAATTRIAGMLASATGATAEEVHAELIANAVPNNHFVPAGVMAVTRAQEYGFSLLYSAA